MNQKMDLSLALQKVNQEYRSIRDGIEEIARSENLIEHLADQYGLASRGNTFEEYEILVNAELKEFNKSHYALLFLKYMIIVFEAFSGYLTIGLVLHIVKIEELINDYWAFGIKLFVAVLLSFGLIHLAITQVKKNFKISLALITIFPFVNLAIVYLSGIEIDYRETYIISSFITLAAGICMLYIAQKEFQKEQSINILKDVSENLQSRKKNYEKAKKHYLKIFNLNTEDNGFLDEINTIPDNNPLYKELKNFLLKCDNFEEWSYLRIDEIKTRFKNRNINQKATN